MASHSITRYLHLHIAHGRPFDHTLPAPPHRSWQAIRSHVTCTSTSLMASHSITRYLHLHIAHGKPFDHTLPAPPHRSWQAIRSHVTCTSTSLMASHSITRYLHLHIAHGKPFDHTLPAPPHRSWQAIQAIQAIQTISPRSVTGGFRKRPDIKSIPQAKQNAQDTTTSHHNMINAGTPASS